jgi:hypothetical protein
MTASPAPRASGVRGRLLWTGGFLAAMAPASAPTWSQDAFRHPSDGRATGGVAPELTAPTVPTPASRRQQ